MHDLQELAAVSEQVDQVKKVQSSDDIGVLLWQAEHVHEWLQELVALWAEELHVEHQPAAMKTRTRVVEKILRSYKGKAECVTDIVRSTILANDVKQVREVLQVEIGEADVNIIKNRFDVSYDAQDSGGYRDVNVLFSWPEFKGTPFEGFIFELQIILRGFAEIKHGYGHEAYQVARNLAAN